jgi:hypothetical protein
MLDKRYPVLISKLSNISDEDMRRYLKISLAIAL